MGGFIMNSEPNIKKINNLVIFKGVVVGLIILFIFSIIFAVASYLFNFNQIPDNYLLIFNLMIIIFIGFFIARRVDYNGWLNGGFGGMIYMGIIVLLGSVSVNITLGIIFLLLITGIVIGSIGGIIGINF